MNNFTRVIHLIHYLYRTYLNILRYKIEIKSITFNYYFSRYRPIFLQLLALKYLSIHIRVKNKDQVYSVKEIYNMNWLLKINYFSHSIVGFGDAVINLSNIRELDLDRVGLTKLSGNLLKLDNLLIC